MCRAYVLLDQTQRQCGSARANISAPQCPNALSGAFSSGWNFEKADPKEREERTGIAPK
jgi:hypothetical protein